MKSLVSVILYYKHNKAEYIVYNTINGSYRRDVTIMMLILSFQLHFKSTAVSFLNSTYTTHCPKLSVSNRVYGMIHQKSRTSQSVSHMNIPFRATAVWVVAYHCLCHFLVVCLLVFLIVSVGASLVLVWIICVMVSLSSGIVANVMLQSWSLISLQLIFGASVTFFHVWASLVMLLSARDAVNGDLQCLLPCRVGIIWFWSGTHRDHHLLLFGVVWHTQCCLCTFLLVSLSCHDLQPQLCLFVDLLW